MGLFFLPVLYGIYIYIFHLIITMIFIAMLNEYYKSPPLRGNAVTRSAVSRMLPVGF